MEPPGGNGTIRRSDLFGKPWAEAVKLVKPRARAARIWRKFRIICVVLWVGCGFSGKGRGDLKCVVLAFEQTGKADAGAVAAGRADDLQPDREARW